MTWPRVGDAWHFCLGAQAYPLLHAWWVMVECLCGEVQHAIADTPDAARAGALSERRLVHVEPLLAELYAGPASVTCAHHALGSPVHPQEHTSSARPITSSQEWPCELTVSVMASSGTE